MSELEATVRYLSERVSSHRRTIFWLISFALLLWLASAVKEITTLLLASYAIALLLDPILKKLGRWKISRGLAVVLIYLVLTLTVLALLVLAIPTIIREYRDLLEDLPQYIHTAVDRLREFAQSQFGINWSTDRQAQVPLPARALAAHTVRQ